MSFIWPSMLALLLLVPLGVGMYVAIGRRRRRRAAGFGGLRAPGESAGRRSRVRRHVPGALVLAGIILLIVALARPEAVVGLPRNEGMVVLAFDVSGSMAADDVAPTRLEAAKAAAREFVLRQPPSVVIGVVTFSDSGFSAQVPTNDQETVLAAIDRLRPQRGTSLAEGIRVALAAIALAEGGSQEQYYSNRSPEPTPVPTPVPQGSHTSAVIVLLTDGENTVRPDPLVGAQAAADRGVRVYTVGIGSAAGTTLTVEGFRVHTELDEATLQQVAALTGGAYFGATEQEDLRRVYDTLDTRLIVKEESTEITSVLAGASLIVLLVGGLSSLFWFGRLP